MKNQWVSADVYAPGPLYKEVRRKILAGLANGDWQPGDQLPTEVELAQRFGVAISTVRAGIRDLTAAGILIRRQGKGTFVARHDVERQQFRFSHVHDNSGQKLVTRRHITSIVREVADNRTREILQLGSGTSTEVHRISATLYVADKAVAVMSIILPANRFPTVDSKDLEQSSENLYAVYQRRYGVTVVRMEERISAIASNAAIARKLGLRKGDPILSVERVAFSFNDLPVEIRHRLYDGSRHHYRFVHDRLD